MNNPVGQTVLPYQWKRSSEYEDNEVVGEGGWLTYYSTVPI